MNFQIWRVERKGSEIPWYSYSLRKGTNDIPIILNQDQFHTMFTGINPEDIPLAPETGIIEIQARMK